MMDKKQMVELLVQAQEGNIVAENELLAEISNTTRYRISRYLNKNRQLENEDIIQEYLIGCANAIHKASLEIGDPIEYIINQGIFAVRGYVRRGIMKGTIQHCEDCGTRHRLHRIKVGERYEYVCRKCGSTNISTYELDDHDETKFEILHEQSFDNTVCDQDLFASFRATLNPNTNIYSLYVELENEIKGDSKNYMQDIAKKWGTSTTNVNHVLKKLRTRFLSYCEENGVDLGISL